VFVIKMDANPTTPPSADAKPPPPSSASAKPRPASGDTKPAPPAADAKKDAKKDARIAKIWANLGAAVGQLDGEPEEMAAAVNALFNAARLQAIDVKNPPVLETFEWCAANKNINGMSKMHLAFVPSLSSHEKTNPGLPQGCSGSGCYTAAGPL
jgi:hypothetical protein